MHWADKIADQLIVSRPNRESFIMAAGISPSGTVHIGNFRDVATIYFVAKALQKKGKKTKLLFSWDNYDRFRKVPKNIPSEKLDEYESYLGLPYTHVPDPYNCHNSYADHYEKEFESSLVNTGIHFDIIRYQSTQYTSGVYKNDIRHALKKRREIFDIISRFKTQVFEESDRENYYPISIYCTKCGKDNTKVNNLDDNGLLLNYSCACGFTGLLDLDKETNFKLPWKVDWPMRWKHEGVDFEPGGKDHAAPQGSYQVSKVISKEIFNFEPPLFQGYEFIGIKGLTGKMSGSSGFSLNLQELLNVYPAEIVLWIYAKRGPLEAFNIGLGEDVIRVYSEFDKSYSAFIENNEKIDDVTRSIFELSLIKDRKIKTVPFNILTTLFSISNEKVDLIENMFKKIGLNFTQDDFKERLKCVSHWMKTYYPEAIIKLRIEPNFDFFATLEISQKAWITSLYNLLKEGIDKDTLQSKLYAIPKNENADNDKVNKENQLIFFKIVYRLLIDRDKGPPLSSLILAIGDQRVLSIIGPLVDSES